MIDAGAPRSFLETFDSVYAPVLGGRRATFRRVFEVLEARRQPFYTIVETGTAHIPDGTGGPGDYAAQGNSTLLFDAFVGAHGGVVWSVDCSPEHCALARRWVSARVRVVCSDSRRFLAGRDELAPAPASVDCLYLDSFDIDWQNPHPSALHHREELRAALPTLAGGCVVFVDDSPGRLGKGGYVVELMERLGATLLFEDYQIGWMLPDPPPPARPPGDPVEAGFVRCFREPRRYRYVRVGFDERVLELLPGGPVGDGRNRCEEQWFVEHTEVSGLELLLVGAGQVTCRLTCGADGVWRGRWCVHERMPVELRPIS